MVVFNHNLFIKSAFLGIFIYALFPKSVLPLNTWSFVSNEKLVYLL